MDYLVSQNCDLIYNFLASILWKMFSTKCCHKLEKYDSYNWIWFQRMLRMSRIRLVRMVRYAEIARFEDPDGYPAMKMSSPGFSLPGVASNDLFPKDHSWAMLKGAKSSGGSASNVRVGICFISSKLRAWNKENKVSDCIYFNFFVLRLSFKQGVSGEICYTLEQGFY